MGHHWRNTLRHVFVWQFETTHPCWCWSCPGCLLWWVTSLFHWLYPQMQVDHGSDLVAMFFNHHGSIGFSIHSQCWVCVCVCFIFVGKCSVQCVWLSGFVWLKLTGSWLQSLFHTLQKKTTDDHWTLDQALTPWIVPEGPCWIRTWPPVGPSWNSTAKLFQEINCPSCEVGDVVSEELGTDLLGDSLEPTATLGQRRRDELKIRGPSELRFRHH